MKKKKAKKKKAVVKPKLKRDKRGRLFPGQPPLNPKGRPKKEACISDQMRAILDEIPKLLPDGEKNTKKLTWAKIVAKRLVAESAGCGAAEFVKTVLDRIEGKVPETLRHGIEDGLSDEEAESIRDKLQERYG